MTFRRFLLPSILLIAQTACSSVPENTRYPVYGINPSKDLLLGPTEKEDLSLSQTCNPLPEQAGRCIVMKIEDYERLRSDLEHYQSKVEEEESHE